MSETLNQTTKGMSLPIFEGSQDLFKFPWLEVSPHGIRHLQLFLLLIKLPMEKVKIDGVNNQIFQFADI